MNHAASAGPLGSSRSLHLNLSPNDSASDARRSRQAHLVGEAGAEPSVEHLFEVRARNLRWEVAHNGVTRPMIDWLFSRERAVEHALDLAEAELGASGGATVRVVVKSGPPSQEEDAEELLSLPRRARALSLPLSGDASLNGATKDSRSPRSARARAKSPRPK